MDPTGHAALVTGAGRRLGRAFAEGLIERGVALAVHYRESAAGAREVAAFAKRRGVKAATIRADLADARQASSLFARATEALGREIDWLVNNASVFEAPGPLDTDLGTWNRALAVNLTAPFLAARAFAKRRGGRPGAIVNILDWRARRPGGEHFAYCVSKAALDAMTRGLALALAPSIRVNGLALGPILPPNGARTIELDRVPMGRAGRVEECVQALFFLLEGPAYISGEVVHVDGGRHLS